MIFLLLSYVVCKHTRRHVIVLRSVSIDTCRFVDLSLRIVLELLFHPSCSYLMLGYLLDVNPEVLCSIGLLHCSVKNGRKWGVLEARSSSKLARRMLHHLVILTFNNLLSETIKNLHNRNLISYSSCTLNLISEGFNWNDSRVTVLSSIGFQKIVSLHCRLWCTTLQKILPQSGKGRYYI